jgi:sarcosine oxidase delta subunit
VDELAFSSTRICPICNWPDGPHHDCFDSLDGIPSKIGRVSIPPQERFNASNTECPKASYVRSRNRSGCPACRRGGECREHLVYPYRKGVPIIQRCGGLSCPYCGPIRAVEFAFAVQLARPEAVVTATVNEAPFGALRRQINGSVRASRRRGGGLQAAWYIEADASSRRLTMFTHSSGREGLIALSETLPRRGFVLGSVRPVDDLAGLHLLVLPSLDPAILVGSRSEASRLVTRHLALNGRSFVHTTSQFWRGEGRFIDSHEATRLGHKLARVMGVLPPLF